MTTKERVDKIDEILQQIYPLIQEEILQVSHEQIHLTSKGFNEMVPKGSVVETSYLGDAIHIQFLREGKAKLVAVY